MARLPGERYLIQQIGGLVILFEDGSEREVVKFDPADAKAAAQAQRAISVSPDLNAEEKVFAHFWSGYFALYAGHGVYGRVDNLVIYDRAAARVVVGKDGQAVASFNPADQNATAQAQKVIYDSGLSGEDKRYAHFWSGYHYARGARG